MDSHNQSASANIHVTAYELSTSSNLANRSHVKRDSFHLSDKEMTAVWTAFGIVWCFAFIANSLTLIVLARIQKTPLNVFIMGLCFSDILSAITSPFDMIAKLTFDGTYPWNTSVCKMLFPVISVASSVTIQLVLVLSAWRFMALSKPMKTTGSMTTKMAKLIVVSCWLITTLIYLPFEAFALDIIPSYAPGSVTCHFRRDVREESRMFILIVDLAILNALPIFAIVVLSIAIGVLVIKRGKKRPSVSNDDRFRRREKKALLQVSLIIASFLIGYIPKFTYFILHITTRQNGYQRAIGLIAWRGVLNITEAINPILYAVGSSVIRNEAKILLGNAFVSSKSNSQALQAEERSNENICNGSPSASHQPRKSTV